MNTFEVVNELKIGDIVEVSGTTIRVEISSEVTELTRAYDGRVYPIGQIGSMVKIHFGRRVLFAFVSLLRMRSEDYLESGIHVPPQTDQRLMEAELFAEGIWSSVEGRLKFSRGVTTYPLPQQSVYLLTSREAACLYEAAEEKIHDDGYNPLVGFAHYVGSDKVVCRANVDKLLAMHCALLGSTGSGKSGAVAALFHSILNHEAKPGIPCRPRIIMIDPHGEYGHAFGDRAVVYRAYDQVTASLNGEQQSVAISLPYWLMSVQEFSDLVIGKTQSGATSQNSIIRKAVTHARMVTAGLVEKAPVEHGGYIPDDDETPDTPRPKAGVKPQQLAGFDADKPIPFCLDELVNHIRFFQAARRKASDKKVLESVTATDFKVFRPVLDKLAVLRRQPRIRFIMGDWTGQGPTLEEVLGQLVGEIKNSKGEAGDIRIIDISGLPNEIAGPLAAMLARLLFQYKMFQTDEERKRDPIALVCEEAHRYVPDRGEAEYSAAQSSIRRIAREGRKYGIGLILISQRPADVEGTVISQCGTWVVLRLTNSADQNHVAKFLPDGFAGMTKALSNLGQQEALFVGQGAALPARVRVRDLRKEQLPKSESAKFLAGWSTEHLTVQELNAIARRMDRKHDWIERELV